MAMSGGRRLRRERRARTAVRARRLSADLYVQFVKAADAGNRAVMADTDEASVTFAHEAEQATRQPRRRHRLKPILQALGYSNEPACSKSSTADSKYRALDRTISIWRSRTPT
jgi:hypothetical protein